MSIVRPRNHLDTIIQHRQGVRPSQAVQLRPHYLGKGSRGKHILRRRLMRGIQIRQQRRVVTAVLVIRDVQRGCRTVTASRTGPVLKPNRAAADAVSRLTLNRP